jgi:hypothetical protein
VAVYRKGTGPGRHCGASGRAGRHRVRPRPQAARQDLKSDSRHLRTLLAEAGCRSAGSRPATSWRHGAPALGEGTLRTERGLAALRAAAAGCLSPAGQLQVATALEVLEALETRMHAVRHQLLAAARHLAGAKVLAARLYGSGRSPRWR